MTPGGTCAIELLDLEFQHDPFPALATRRHSEPVFQPDDIPAFVLTRYDDVLGMRDEAMYSVSFIKMVRESIDGPSMIQMDGAEHHRNRSLVAVGFRPRFLNEFVEARVEPIVRRLIDDLRPRGRAELMRDFCEPLPFYSIAELLGFETDDQRALSTVYRDFIASDPVQVTADTVTRSMQAREVIDDLLTPIVDWHMANATDGFISRMIRAENKDGERLREEEVYGFLRFLLPAGEDTTMSALGTLMYNVLSRPSVRGALERDPSVLTAVVEESLRWRAPIAYVNRVTVSDQMLHGVHIPAGSLVLGALDSANRDEAVFEHPDEFDIARDPNRHLTFGTGVHMCIGAPLARSTLRRAAGALLAELPNLRLADGFEPRYEGLFSSALRELPVEWDPA